MPVSHVPPTQGEPAVAYATAAELAAEPGAPELDAAAAAGLLRRASVKVDRMLGPWPILGNGLKFGDPLGANPRNIEDYQRDALARATIQLAVAMDQESTLAATMPAGVKRTQGPDFEIEYQDPGTAEASAAQQARTIVSGAGLVRNTAGF